MYAQIIFFVALILFVVLLVRRFSRYPETMRRAGQLALGWSRKLGQFLTRAGLGAVQGAKKLKGSIPLLSDRVASKPGIIGDHQFWQEELPNETSEIPGLFEEGDEYFRQGKYDKAEEFFLKAASRSPAEARVYARLGVIYLQQKNFNDAIEALKVAVKLYNYNSSRHYNLALAYLANNDRQKATVSARETITLDPVTKKYRQLLDHLLERK